MGILKQPFILKIIPFVRNGDAGQWVIDQGKVPGLIKFNQKKIQYEIDQIEYFHNCEKLSLSEFVVSSECNQMQRKKILAKKLNRSPWRLSK